MRWHDEDPGLPIKLGPCSNGEFDPFPVSPLVREAVRQARAECEENAARLGMSRRRFLLSACGAATTLMALAACSEDEAKDQGRPAPGSTFDVPSSATTDPDAAKEAVGGEDFIFDLQTHFLEFSESTSGGLGFLAFPQGNCGEDDERSCFSMVQYLDELFLRSDTSMVVLSAVPIAPEGSPLSSEIMDQARRLAEAACDDKRVLLHALALPNVGAPDAGLAAMEEAVDKYPIAAWKGYTHYQGGGPTWRLDDAIGERFLTKAEELDVRVVCIHKGLSGGNPAASPVDMGPAAKAHPDISFVAYHSGFDRRVTEGAFDPAAPNAGVDRLIASMRDSGIGPNQNVYAELGSTWRALMSQPDAAAHVLGKLLVHVGADNVVWGTDSIWYGSPQDQIQAFRAFQITPEFQERFGYPALTKEIKRKILGANGARLHNVDPITVPCELTRDELEKLRQELPGDNRTLGPRTAAEVRALVASHQGWPA